MDGLKVEKVNEDGNFIIEINNNSKWQYITQEYSFSSAVYVMSNLHIATNKKCRVLSIRSNNKVMSET